MNIKTSQAPKLSQYGKVARIIIRPDGGQEFVFDDDEASIADIPSHPSFAAGSATFFAANQVAQMDHSQITKLLDSKLTLIRPDNGWDNVATNIEAIASDSTVQNVVVSFAAGSASYPLWQYLLKKVGIDSPKIALGASVAVAVVVFALLNSDSSSVSVEQCNEGFSSYQGELGEAEFKEACAKGLEE